jgi:hypothetical protein
MSPAHGKCAAGEFPKNDRLVRKVEPMKKSTTSKKASTAKKHAHARKAATATSVQRAAPSSTMRKPLVSAQPRSKKDAAAQAGMFLYTNDKWSLAYFNAADLHCLERELFG